MSKVIKFEDKSLEDRFFDTLSDEQHEMFEELLLRIAANYEDLEERLIQKSAEVAVAIEELEMAKQTIKELKEKFEGQG